MHTPSSASRFASRFTGASGIAFIAIFLFSQATKLWAQEAAIPQRKTDSLLAIVGYPEIKYELNFGFHLEEVDDRSPNAQRNAELNEATEDELREMLTGQASDCWIYDKLTRRKIAAGERGRVMENLRPAVDNFGKYLDQNPQDTLAWETYADLLTITDNQSIALRTLEKAIDKHPGYPGFYERIYQIKYFYNGDFEGGTVYLDSLVKRFPNRAAIPYYQMMVNYAQHLKANNGEVTNEDEILQPIYELLDRAPSSIYAQLLAHFSRAYVYLSIKMIAGDAEEALSKAQLKKMKDMVKFLEKLKQEGGVPQRVVSQQLALAHLVLGNRKKTIGYLSEELAQTEDPAARQKVAEAKLLVQMSENFDKHDKNILLLKSKLDESPNAKDAVALAISYGKNGDDGSAKKQLGEAMKLDDTFATAWQLKAYYAVKDQLPKADAILSKARELSHDPEYPFLLSVVLVAQVEGAAEANNHLQQLLDVQPDHASALEIRRLLTE